MSKNIHLFHVNHSRALALPCVISVNLHDDEIFYINSTFIIPRIYLRLSLQKCGSYAVLVENAQGRLEGEEQQADDIPVQKAMF